MKTVHTIKYAWAGIAMMIGLSIGAHAQMQQDSIVYLPEVERAFVSAMKLFQSGQMDSAAASYVRIIKEYPHSHRSTGAMVMGAKAYFELKDYRESIRLLKDLLDLYPQSTYADDAHYSLGLNYDKLGRYEDAAAEFLSALEGAGDQRLLSRSETMIESLASSSLSIEELQSLLAGAKQDASKALAAVCLAKKLLHSGDAVLAQEMLRKVAAMPPGIKYAGQAAALLDQMEKHGGLKLGVELPLMLKLESPAERGFGVEFLQGIQIAVDEYNRTMPVKISLEIRDTEKNPSSAARQVAELCSDEKVAAIIGPVLSNEVFASAGIANERGVPLITPTATANGIAAIGPFIFQANPDFDTRARATAAFAYRSLGARRFAVLALADAVGKQMGESFLAEVAQLGGEVIDVEWYASGATDLRTELTVMRRKALERLETPTIDFGGKMRQTELDKIMAMRINQHLLDSLIERNLKAPVTLLFGERGKIIADSLKLPVHVEHLNYDSLRLPVQNIDAIFVPIASSDEIPVVSSQLKFFNVQAQILGTGDWNDIGSLDQNRQYTDGCIFTVDAYSNPASELYRAFAAKYQAANGKLPGTNALFGYDVTKMILQVIAKGTARRTDIAGALSKVRDYEGLHSKISLALNRVNGCLTVLQYKGRQILKIGEIDLSAVGK